MRTPDTDLIKKYISKEITDNEFAKAFFPYIRNIAISTAKKYYFDGDDLSQELWQLFNDKIIHSFNHEMNLDSYVYAFAKRHCMHMRGENRDYSFTSLERDGDPESGDPAEAQWMHNKEESVVHLDDEGIDSKIKGQQLISKTLGDIGLLKKLPSIQIRLETDSTTQEDIARELVACGFSKDNNIEKVLESVSQLSLLKNKAKETSNTSKKELPKENAELREIRIKMQKNKPQFARDIGIHLSSLDAYEYGRTKTVPEDVMTRARELERNFTDDLAHVRAKFGSMEMSKIVAMWANQCGMEIGDADGLSVLLCTTRTTLRRWLNDESKADIERIAQLDEMVNKLQPSNEN
jgi:DNA-binding transcriptional regulator YiaG